MKELYDNGNYILGNGQDVYDYVKANEEDFKGLYNYEEVLEQLQYMIGEDVVLFDYEYYDSENGFDLGVVSSFYDNLKERGV